MPYTNEHAARIRDPGLFDPSSFRSKDLKNGVRIIIGKLKFGNESMVTQAYRFSVDKFTPEEAKKWLKDNKIAYLKFEPAQKESEESLSHVGVKGMRWGVRKDRSGGQDNRLYRAKSPSSVAGIIAKRVGPHSFKTVYKPKPGDSSDHALYSAIRKKKVKDMSDEELNSVTKRTLLLSLYKKSGAFTRKKARQMSNDELQGHVDKYLLRKAIGKSPVRRWKFKDFIKTYKLNDAETKKLLERVNKENMYYDAKNAQYKEVKKYVESFLNANP